MRSVHSIINRSPPELLKQVILADDFSDKPFLKGKLDKYVSETWPDGRVKIVRTKKREGLIRARLIGAREANTDVILFLDSHSECNNNWLPPLIEVSLGAWKHCVSLCSLAHRTRLSHGGVSVRGRDRFRDVRISRTSMSPFEAVFR